MIALLDLVGQAIWRASWQAAILAVLVALLLWCLGERLAPRWRFLLWGVVLMRLLLVATPGSPWSMFHLARWNSEATARPILPHDAEPKLAPVPLWYESSSVPNTRDERPEASRAVESAPELSLTPPAVPARKPIAASHATTQSTTPVENRFYIRSITRILSSIWVAGCLLFGLRLLLMALVLRRRLSACRPVTDAAVLDVLETCRRRIGLKQTPALLVTPGCLSPCIVGTWNPKIVLPESFMTQSSSARLRHVLAHELAHLVRGDLWTNWLLLSARTLHWFNPVAWWTVREMQAEREAACDELAFAALGEADRNAYATTIVELAASLLPSPLAPGLIGLFPSRYRLKARIERFVRAPSVKTFRAPVAAGLLAGMALLGLTDALPDAKAQAPDDVLDEEVIDTETKQTQANTHTVTGRCVDDADRSAIGGIMVRLVKVEGRTSLPVMIAETITDGEGRFTFTGLEPPRPEGRVNHLIYVVLGFADDRRIGTGFLYFHDDELMTEIRMPGEMSTLAGKVTDTDGRPVPGATVTQHAINERPIPGFPSAITDADGRFELDRLPVYKLPDGTVRETRFSVVHENHPVTSGKVSALPADVVVTLLDGCVLMGAVTDAVSGQPAEGAVITARRVDEWGETFAATDASGQFRLVVPEGRYDILAEAKDRVCVALTGHECLAGEEMALPRFTLIRGGYISGRVVNTATGEAVSVSDKGEPIMLGLFGPSYPAGQVVSAARMATVDETGQFTLRAAPGENFPYFVNTRGERMTWDTQKQPAVVVKEGETIIYNMLITPPVSPEEKLQAAHKVVAALSDDPTDRTTQILLEFRKLNHTVDETELWCLLMRELVEIGHEAVPQLCAELDRTSEDRMLRRLGFALRAIGDPRAVPALVRAFPKSLLPSSSDYGLIVEDKELTEFMQRYDLQAGKGGKHFGLGRAVREVVGALQRLTGQNFDDSELFSISLSEDPRRQVLQRRVYERQAKRWQEWWEANWRNFTDDAEYHTVNLDASEEPVPPASQKLGKSPRLTGEMVGAVLSPATEEGQHIWRAYDLDTGYRPSWPNTIPKEYAARDARQVTDWAAQTGVDLICVTYRSPDGTETYVLRALGMKVWELSPRDFRNLDRLIAGGTLPEGRPVDDLLMHYDTESQQFVPDADASFLYVTREGSRGVIETTDRVTRTADLTGLAAGSPMPGVGFQKGVRFNLKTIIP